MKTEPIQNFPVRDAQNLIGLATDIDDTLTTNGKLLPAAYQALGDARDAGLRVLVITGRPAGWVDHIARMWPVDGVIGENGAFYFYMHQGKLKRVFLQNEKERLKNRQKLHQIAQEIVTHIPGCALASDQPYRECDVAIDYCEDVEPLPKDAVQKIVSIFQKYGVTCKVSSIHVNGWIGRYDKLKMTKNFVQDVLGMNLEKNEKKFVFFGDSPNDEPLFAFFTHSIGVANIHRFLEDLKHPPRWITQEKGSLGFQEGVKTLLEHLST